MGISNFSLSRFAKYPQTFTLIPDVFDYEPTKDKNDFLKKP
jgi:hypothetical protein